MTEHRCNGKWKPGKVKNCATCKAKQPPRSIKKSSES